MNSNEIRVYIYPSLSLSLHHHPPQSNPIPSTGPRHSSPQRYKVVTTQKKIVTCRVFSECLQSAYRQERCCVEKGFTCYYKAQQMWERSEKCVVFRQGKSPHRKEMINPASSKAYAWAKMARVAQKLERLSASVSRPLPPELIMLTDALVERPKMLMLLELSISLMCSWQFWPTTHFWS
jgi:hypothetical protein